jgi:hypothetical protein
MVKINILQLILTPYILASSFIPHLEGTFCINPLFPSNQKLYYASSFGDNLKPIDTIGRVHNFTSWMPGYSISCKFGEFSLLKLGLNLKFDHFFQHKDSMSFYEVTTLEGFIYR